jgi:hypothetical protein
MYVFTFSLQILSKSFPIPWKIKRDIIINVYRASCKVPIILVRFNENWIFSTDFSKNTQISNSIKIRPVGAELFHTDGRTGGRTDRQTDIKQTIAFRNFATAPKPACKPNLAVQTLSVALHRILRQFFLWQSHSMVCKQTLRSATPDLAGVGAWKRSHNFPLLPQLVYSTSLRKVISGTCAFRVNSLERVCRFRLAGWNLLLSTP